jgi:hypothetical protein
MFVVKEWIPVNIRPANQSTAVALVIGIWVLFAMDWNYCNAIVGYHLT